MNSLEIKIFYLFNTIKIIQVAQENQFHQIHHASYNECDELSCDI